MLCFVPKEYFSYFTLMNHTNDYLKLRAAHSHNLRVN